MAIKVEHRIGISAPVDAVWDTIADINGWTAWSPIHKAASGELHFGGRIHLEESYEGLGVWEIDGVIGDWTPLSHIHVSVPKSFYAGSLIRFFEFDALSDRGCAFSIGAVFSGFLSEREGKRYRPYLRKGFEAFSEALKQHVEALVRDNPDAYPPRAVQDNANARPEPRKKDARSRWAPPKTWKIGTK